MKKYYVSNSEGIAKPSDASDEFDSADEAIQAAEYFKKEILKGVYDEEWCISEDERGSIANNVRAYVAEISNSGTVRSVSVL